MNAQVSSLGCPFLTAWIPAWNSPLALGFFAAALIAVLAAILYALHRGCIWLERAGYIYYREKSKRGAFGSAMGGLDEIIRPTIEHIEQAKEDGRYQVRRRHGDDL